MLEQVLEVPRGAFSFWIVGRRGTLGGSGVVAGKSTESMGYLQTSMEVLQYFNNLS